MEFAALNDEDYQVIIMKEIIYNHESRYLKGEEL